jgi:2-polyprenyl-3-methyl-5-hydroxy-6-metoxy-1,4-benzoquinol methylase
MMKSWLGSYLPGLVTSQTWDQEYASGAWDYLSSDIEFPRYAVILGHLLRLDSPAVLDVGCGHGRLLEVASKLDISRYVGLDVSQEAIARAQRLASPVTSFAVSDAESFRTDQRFDAIVFNEVTTYLRHPTDVLERYAGMLNEGGKLIVSQWRCRPARVMWWQLTRRFETAEHTRVTSGPSWDVKVLKLRTKK